MAAVPTLRLNNPPFHCPRLPFSFPHPPSIAISRLPSNNHPKFCCHAAVDSNNTSIDNVKSQLEILHSEAEQTRSRANAARNRFMRLTETIENLRMRAGIELKAGKEETAKQLIAEKQKIMQALEKSKRRAELLEELSNKLGEAISRKETHLIALLSSSNLGVDDDNSCEITSVRVVSPKMKDNAGDLRPSSENPNLEQAEVQDIVNSAVSDTEFMEPSFSSDHSSRNKAEESKFSAGSGSGSYVSFLLKVDADLCKLEAQLHDFIAVATMILPNSIDTTANEKVAAISQIWNDVQSIRERVLSSGLKIRYRNLKMSAELQK